MVQHNEEHITTYLGYGYLLCHNPALEYMHNTEQYWYVSYWSKYSSDISIYCYPIITIQQLVVTSQYWTPFSTQTIGVKTSEHQTSFIAYTSWDLFWVTAGPRTIIDGKLQTLWFQGPLIPAHVAVGRWQLAKWPRSDLIRKKNIVSIYPRCWVIDEIIISLRWWPFWIWCHIGSHPNLVMVASTFHVGIGPSYKVRQVSYIPGGCMWGPLGTWSN